MEIIQERPPKSIPHMTTTERGRHAELLAQTALLANGFTVLEPIAPESFDLAIMRIGEKDTKYVQVKTAFSRNEPRYGGEYIVVRGAKNNGKVYTKSEVDYFVAVWQGAVYMFPNRLKSEYWVRPRDLATRWTELSTDINEALTRQGGTI